MDVRETVMVFPEPGMFPEIGRALLDVADHPRDVVYVSSPQAGFQVPADLFERFEAARPGLGESTQQEGSAAQTESDKPRRGRPRKNTDPGKDK